MKLTSLYLFAKNVRSLLHTYHYQQLFLHEFSMAYTKYVGETLQPKTYGYSSVEELLGAIPQVGIFSVSWRVSSWRATGSLSDRIMKLQHFELILSKHTYRWRKMNDFSISPSFCKPSLNS